MIPRCIPETFLVPNTVKTWSRVRSKSSPDTGGVRNVEFVQGPWPQRERTLTMITLRESMNSWIPEFMNSCIHESWIPEFLNSWTHEFMNSRIHEFMDSWIHEFMDSWIHEFMDSWIHGFMDSWIHEFMNSLIREFITGAETGVRSGGRGRPFAQF